MEENIEGRIEVTGRRGRRCKQLLNVLKENKGYWDLKGEALDRSLWRTRFGRSYGNVIRQYSINLLVTVKHNKYRVIRKSLRNFQTRLRNNQERHGRKEHINR